SFLSSAAPAAAAAAGTPPAPAPAAPAKEPEKAKDAGPSAPPFAREAGKDAPGKEERKILYEGVPSWKAFLGMYIAAGFGACLLIVILRLIHGGDPPLMT